MTKTNVTKKALLSSIIAILLCLTMLLGTTFAWFTDEVSSTNNIIKSGTLEVSLEHSDKVLGADEDGWIDASTGTIFNYDKWEPGYTALKYVKIENEGTLDLKFMLSIIPNAKATGVNLADVIEVYMINNAVAVDRSTLTTANPAYVGTLTSLINEKDGAAYGVLYADDADKNGNVFEIYTIALKMSESAGNEYQDKNVGGGFSVQLLATQLNSESDSFDTSYDIDAEYKTEDDTPVVTPPVVYVGSAADLKAALTPSISNDKAEVILTNDITLAAGEEWTPLNLEAYTGTVRNIVIDGQGHSISGLNAPLLGHCYFGNTSIEIKDLTLKECNIVDKYYNGLGSGAFVAYADNCSSVVLDNCHLVDSTVTSTADFTAIGGLVGYSSSTLTITDCSVTGSTITGTQNSAGAIAGHISAGHDSTLTNVKVVDCTVKGERVDKTGYVVGTSNNGNTIITTDAACANNTVFDVANSTTVYGRIVGGTLTLNGVAK